MKPLGIDLFCGLGGFTEGMLAEGFDVVGFDIERHHYGEAKYPAQLVLQDVLTIHGRQFKDAALIVASPPCQEYSYMAMPWSIAKQKARDYESGVRDVKQLTALFDACFRIQREACEASGRYIPLVVENVRGAQRWVGCSRYHFGSFHLWGDVPALMPMTRKHVKVNGFRFDGSGKSFQTASVKASKAGCREHDGEGTENWCSDHDRSYCLSCDGDCPECSAVMEACDGEGTGGLDHQPTGGDSRRDEEPQRVEAQRSVTSRDCDVEAEHNAEGNKGFGSGLLGKNPMARRHGSKSAARKRASAYIAKIPLVLSRHIARAWHP